MILPEDFFESLFHGKCHYYKPLYRIYQSFLKKSDPITMCSMYGGFEIFTNFIPYAMQHLPNLNNRSQHLFVCDQSLITWLRETLKEPDTVSMQKLLST